MVTIQKLREKIALVQAELAEVSAALEELARLPVEGSPDAPPHPPDRLPPAGPKFTDPQTALAALDKAFAQMGIDVTRPALSPEEVQQLMLREGVRPEDFVLSKGIIDAREE
jgi:hypothetical protein